jgi:DNA-binding MarR family transcriptional regulator
MLITLNILSSALQTFAEFTNEPDVQIQTVQTFLIIADQGNPGVNELARRIALTQPSASRNLRKLCVAPRGQEGYGLITMELDPLDNRRKIIRLTARGHELVRLIEEAMCRVLAPTLFRN